MAAASSGYQVQGGSTCINQITIQTIASNRTAKVAHPFSSNAKPGSSGPGTGRGQCCAASAPAPCVDAGLQ